jgi:dTDP-4-dehydrorhamnose 3,5-epimerase
MSYYTPTSKLQVSENFYKTSLPGLFYFKAPKFNDERGFFSEIIKLPELEKVIGQSFAPQQINLARSEENVVRGMHAEGWNKLVFVNSGLAFCAIADVKPNSPTYKQSEYFQLGYDNEKEFGQGLFISQGLANSVAVLKGPLNYIYIIDKLYADRDQADERSISLFDPELNINWPIAKEKIILSDRDKQAVSLKDFEN